MCNGYSTYNPSMSFIGSWPLPSNMEVSELRSISVILSGASKGLLTVPGSSLIAAPPLIAVSLRCVLKQGNAVGPLEREGGRGEREGGGLKPQKEGTTLES